MKPHNPLEGSPTKQQMISRQRRERAKSDELDDVYPEDKVQKVRLIDESQNAGDNQIEQEDKGPSEGMYLRGRKLRALSQVNHKESHTNSSQNSNDSFNKRGLIPFPLQKQLNGPKKNKKLSLDETISKLKAPAGKSVMKNLEKMRFLATVQQQELEALLKGKNSGYSSNSDSSRANSPLLQVFSREETTLSPNRSAFGRGNQTTLPNYNKSQDNFFDSLLNSHESKISHDGRENYLGNQVIDNNMESESSQAQMNNYGNPLNYRNDSPGFHNQQNIDYTDLLNLPPSSQHLENKKSGIPKGRFAFQHSNSLGNPNTFPDRLSFTSHSGEGGKILLSRGLSDQEIGGQDNNFSTYTTFPSSQSTPMNPSLNPKDLVDQQFLKITNFLSQKTTSSLMLHSPANSHHSNNSPHAFKRSSSLNAQERLNLVSNLNTLQLQSNLVAEKFINSPIQGHSPAISRTNTDPSQLKNLIKSIRGEKKGSGTPNQNDYHSGSEVLSNAAEQEEGHSLTHTNSGSLLHAGFHRAEENEKPQWDPFSTEVAAPKTDNISLFAKRNPGNAPASVFKRSNIVHKTYTKVSSNPFEDLPIVTHTKTDPNDLKDTIISFQNKYPSIESNSEIATNPVSTKQFADNFPCEQLQGGHSYFGPSSMRRINTNPTHLTSLIKSMHFNNPQNMMQNPLQNQSKSCLDVSIQRSDFMSTDSNGNSNRNSEQHVQADLPIETSPSSENFEIQKPIIRTNTDPTDWRSFCKPNNVNPPRIQGKMFNINTKQLSDNQELWAKGRPNDGHSGSYQLNVTNEEYPDFTPVFNPGANSGFDKLFEMNSNHPQMQHPSNLMAVHRTKTDPTSIRAVMNDRNFLRPPPEEFKRYSNDPSYNNFTEDGTSMSGLLKKFNNFQLQSPSNVQSELSSEDQINNDGYLYARSIEIADSGINSYQKIDLRQPQQVYQQYDYLGSKKKSEKPVTAQALADQDAWVLFPNQASSNKSKLFDNFHGKQYQNDVDQYLSSNKNHPIMESQEEATSRGLFDL